MLFVPRSVRQLARIALLLAIAAPVAACSSAPRISVAGQRARLSPVLVGVCAVFLKIENPGGRSDVLIGASAEVPGAITELHEVSNGRMFRTDKVPIPANGAVELRPGGVHIMVFNLPKGTGAGSEFTLRLVFERSGEQRTSVRISG